MKIFFWFSAILFLITSCFNHVKDSDEENEKYALFLEYVCAFILEKNENPNSKAVFEAFLKERIDGHFILPILSGRKYDFRSSADQDTIFIYDWGKKGTNEKDDALHFIIDSKKCVERERFNQRIVFLQKNELVEDRMAARIISEIINIYIAGRRVSKDEIYVPMVGEKMKHSVIHFVREDADWIFSIKENEHDLVGLRILAELIKLELEEDLVFNKIDQIVIPVRYFDNSQVIKL